MKVRTALLAVLLGCLLVAGAPSVQANHNGCAVFGSAQSNNQGEHCTYTAASTSQDVIIGTPNYWQVWTVREGRTVTFAEGRGPPESGPVVTVTPNIGELVYVTIWHDCPDEAVTNQICGMWGAMIANPPEAVHQ